VQITSIVNKQCGDDDDRARKMHEYFQKQLTDYITRDLLPYLKN